MTKYEDHVAELCSKHKIKIERSRGVNAVNMLDKVIWINPTLRSIKTYFGALHEIGHVINEHPLIYFNMNRVLWNQSRSKSCVFVSKYRMQTEVDAWKRAYEIASWSSPVADKLTVTCLFTYIYGYNESHKKPFKDIDNDFMTYIQTEHKNDNNMMSKLKDLLFA